MVKKTVDQKTPKTSKKSTVSNKKTISKSKKKKDMGVIKKNEKKELIADLKSSVHSMGRLPGIVMAPVIAFVSKKYDSIPAQRRKSLQGISKKLKSGSSDGMSHLKDWFRSTSANIKKVSDDTQKSIKKKPPTKKKTAKKKSIKTKKKVPIKTNNKNAKGAAKKVTTKTKKTTKL